MKRNYINYLILIPVHNEEIVIDKTLNQLNKINYNHTLFKIIILLDNCIDNSVEVVKKNNFDYLEKKDKLIKGKAYTLNWFLKNFKKIINYNNIIILDADTIIQKDFLKKISNYKDKILQSFVKPSFDKNSITSSLSAYSEILSQEVKDNIKSKLNWNIVLRGTGMIIDTEVFKKYIPLLKTQIEDTELSILLVKDGYKIKFLPEAIVYDPKPLNIKQSSNQRARWLYGQLQVIRYYWKDLFKIAFSNIGNFFFVLDVVFKPKTLFYIIKILILLFFIFTNLPFKNFFIIIFSILITIDILYFLIGGFFIEDKKHYYKTLLFSPIYIVIWFMSILKIMFFRGKKWLKAR